MELLEHLLYHELLDGRCTLADAVHTIERYLTERDLIDSESLCADAERIARTDATLGSPGNDSTREAGTSGASAHSDHDDEIPPATGCIDSELARQVYGALLVQTLFERFSVPQIRDIINLAHKEALAREIWLRLRDEPVDLHAVERLLERFADLPLGESQISVSLAIGIRVQLISTLISDNLFFIGVAKNYITMRDVAALMNRFIGKFGQKSRVGGKSAGMILANRILHPVFGEPTGLEDRIAEVESYYLTAQVFNRFIEHNRLQEGHSLKYMEPDEREAARVGLERRFLRGEFPQDVVEELDAMLAALGEGPLIVRSSSLLEDSIGFPFYGKYESHFIANQGSQSERLDALLDAIRRVYISILASSVIEYRRDKALLDYDDMMCVLIQRVVGSQHGSYFFPAASGVAFSVNQYRWSRRIDPAAGVARIVYGLGTRAVDRSGDDYPRLVALSHPELRPEGTESERMKYSQRNVDVLDLTTRRVESVHFVDLINTVRDTEEYEPYESVSPLGPSVTALAFPDRLEYGSALIGFDGLLRDGSFPTLLRDVLQRLESAYGVPVDIEFAWEGAKLYVLQCRPLAQGSDSGARVEVPHPSAGQRLLFETRRDIFRNTERSGIRHVVYVDGERYHALADAPRKLEVARTLGRINRKLPRGSYMLVGPGRWGTSNLELGVRVSYADINHAAVLAEVGRSRTGYTPEVSYGTHFFQDLIEANIMPLALFPDEPGEEFDTDILGATPEALGALLGKDEMPAPEIAACINVLDLDEAGTGRLSIWLSADDGRGIGLLGT